MLQTKPGRKYYDLLDQFNAQKLKHKDIAQLLVVEHEVSAWWTQSITEEYERFIGRREVGQTCTGDFQASASKTVSGDKDTTLNYWKSKVKNLNNFNEVSQLSVVYGWPDFFQR